MKNVDVVVIQPINELFEMMDSDDCFFPRRHGSYELSCLIFLEKKA